MTPPKILIKLGGVPYNVSRAPLRDHYELEHASEPTQVCSGKKDKDSKDEKLLVQTSEMAEPRVRLSRHQGQLNFGPELRHLLHAYGDPSPHPSFPQEPLPETVRVLDEIVTDFIIETCHTAAACAHHARRQKVKVDDFRFALRRDPIKLGRVQELFRIERELKEARKAFDQNDDRVVGLKDAGKKGLEDLAESLVDGTASTKGTGRKGKSKPLSTTTTTVTSKRGSDVATDGAMEKKRKVGNSGSVA